ncbi:DUF2165 family protein [uncultured Shewanella sp.]|uniref:DUF2165 family protein n=1 Tax=uncultured Shewanella sp. TaxID=173975 RepID=UPI002611610B|nr:DUF2165 domain-containing protein [uncultured Shewanella sp.]
MTIRYVKIVLIWSVAVYAGIVAWNNMIDYESNYGFVFHVLKMDTTYPTNEAMSRAIETPILYHLVYGFIIAIEGLIALLSAIAGVLLIKHRHNHEAFNGAKHLAVVGLTLGILLWFTGFLTIGGEWFLMWQSTLWNGQQAAYRLVVVFLLILIVFLLPDDFES